MRKIAANEPLWYGRSGDEPFLYEESDWHKKHVRFSDEIKTSDGETTTLQGGNSESPDSGKIRSDDEITRSGDDSDVPSPLKVQQRRYDNGDSLSPGPMRGYDSDGVSPLGAESRARMRKESELSGVSPLASRDISRDPSRPGSRRTVDDNTVVGDDEAAPSPNISRTSVDKYGRMRSPGQGY